MGGKSKSSSSSSSTQNSLNVALEDLENSSSVIATGDNNRVTTTDHGAIQSAADIAFESLENQAFIADSAIRSSADGAARNTAAIERVAMAAQTQGQTVVADSLVSIFRPLALAMLAGLVVVIIYNVYKRGRA